MTSKIRWQRDVAARERAHLRRLTQYLRDHPPPRIPTWTPEPSPDRESLRVPAAVCLYRRTE